MDSLLHAVTNSISFHHLQAFHSHWAPCHLPQVLCQFPLWASCISQVLAWPHLGHPTLQALYPPWDEAPLHTFAQPPTSTSTLGLILSPSSDPIPHRLVSRIQTREFIEMWDLLADIISFHNQLEDFHDHIWPSTSAHLRPRLREIPSLSSWVYCFCAYIAVLTPALGSCWPIAG